MTLEVAGVPEENQTIKKKFSMIDLGRLCLSKVCNYYVNICLHIVNWQPHG